MRTNLKSSITFALCLVFGLSSVSAKDLSLDDLFPSDRVLDVKITVNQDDWDLLRFQSRTFQAQFQESRKYKAIENPYTYVDANISIDGVEYPKVGIRKKGFFGSQDSRRPSLKIKLNHQTKKNKIGGLTNLTFNNNKQDTGLISQHLGYQLFNKAGSPAPRTAFAHVSVNGQPLGIYTHVETVRDPLLLRNFGPTKGTLYEGAIMDFFEGWEQSFEHKTGDDDAGRKRIRDLIEALSLESEKGLIAALEEVVDLDAFFNFWALEGLLGFWDGYSGNINNFFVFLDPATDKLRFLPWGADALFVEGFMGSRRSEQPTSVKTKGLLAHRLYQLQSGRERYEKTLRQLLDTIWNEESLLAEIDRVEALIQPHLDRSQHQFGESMNKTRDFIRTRRKGIENEIVNGMPLWDDAPKAPMTFPGGEVIDPKQDPIWSAVKSGNMNLMNRFLNDETNLDARDQSGQSLLDAAVISGKEEIANLLIEQGADPTSKGREDGSTPLHSAAFLGYTTIAELLVNNGAEINPQNGRGQTPLDIANEAWNQSAIRTLKRIAGFLQIEIDISEVRSARPLIAKLLTENGGIAGEPFKKTPGEILGVAAKAGDLEKIKRFAERREALNLQGQHGITPIGWAALAGQTEAARLLIQYGADPNTKNQDGGSALEGACFLGHLDIVKLLISKGADINAINARGETALDGVTAPWSGDLAGIVQWVVEALALKVDQEKVKADRPKIREFLISQGAKTAAAVGKN